jgi:tetratricopeptide (TPR) repeat protein
MKPFIRWVLICGAVVLVVLGRIWLGRTIRSYFAAKAKEVAAAQSLRPAPGPLPKGRMFTRVEANAFLDAAKRAEAIADPLQRCLAYPDPPGSHWDHAAVVAYCRYHNQPTISFAQVRQMIQAGRGRELDRMFDAALQAQATDPDAYGRLDSIFSEDFSTASFDIRSTLDAWKRQSPDSAFAWAASGYEYERMAYAARGADLISRTPQSALDAMDRLAGQADADLKHALALNPKVTPAYRAMISLGGMALGRKYAEAAVQRGLVQDPDNLDIYDQWMWLEQPNWYGSLDAMSAVARDAQKHAHSNPMLRMLNSSRDIYRIQKCKCTDAVELSAYEGVLDKLAGWRDLKDAGYAAKDANDPPAMTIYLSESLRFNPDQHDTRIDRIYDLVDFDRVQWAIDEANRLIAASPDDEYSVKARGWAYLIGNDLPHARKDFETAERLNPSDGWVLAQLGGLYIGSKQWDKAWDIANRMIQKAPQDVRGWSMRAAIQMQQPRPGLKETADYLESHFYTDKKNLRFNAYIAHLRAVAQGKVKGTLVLDSHG